MWNPLAVICSYRAGREIFRKLSFMHALIIDVTVIHCMHKRPRFERSRWPTADYRRLAFNSKRLTGVLPVSHASVLGGFQPHVRKVRGSKGRLVGQLSNPDVRGIAIPLGSIECVPI